MRRYSAMPPQTPAIILLRFERVSRRGFASPSIFSSVVDHAVLLGLVQRHPDEPGGGDPTLELPPDSDNDVFGRRVPSREEIHVEIEVPAIEPGDDALLDRALQLREVHNVAGLRIDLPFDRNLELVRVPVTVRVVALLEDPPVGLLVPVVAVQAMGRREVRCRDEPDFHGPIICRRGASGRYPIIPGTRALITESDETVI